MKLLIVLTGVSFICDISSPILINWKISPNYAGNTYRFAEFVLLATIYYKSLNNTKLFKQFIFLNGLFFIFFTLNLFLLDQEKINSYSEIFSAFVFIALSVGYFYRIMNELPVLQIQHLPMFWINTAVLTYFAGNLFLFILVNYLVNTLKHDLIVYWTFHNLLNVTKNFLFAVGLWQNPRTTKLL